MDRHRPWNQFLVDTFILPVAPLFMWSVLGWIPVGTAAQVFRLTNPTQQCEKLLSQARLQPITLQQANEITKKHFF